MEHSMPPRATRADLEVGNRLLIRYETPTAADPGLWHERLLLGAVRSSTWVVCSPTLDVYAEDVLHQDVDVVRCGPRGGLPNGLQGRVFRLDETEVEDSKDWVDGEAVRVLAAERGADAGAGGASGSAGSSHSGEAKEE